MLRGDLDQIDVQHPVAAVVLALRDPQVADALAGVVLDREELAARGGLTAGKETIPVRVGLGCRLLRAQPRLRDQVALVGGPVVIDVRGQLVVASGRRRRATGSYEALATSRAACDFLRAVVF